MIGQIQRDPAVALAERLDTNPDHFARCGHRVEIRRIVDVDPCRQDLGFQDRRRQRRALQLLDGVEQRVGAIPPLDDPLPRRRETAEHRLIDRLDLVAQLGERAAAQHAQHAGVRPLTPRTARPELALDQTAFHGQSRQHRFGSRRAEPVSQRELRGGERRVRARVAQRQIAQRIADRLQQRLGNADRHRHAQRVAKARGVLDGDQARIAGDANCQHPASGDQLRRPCGDVRGQRPLADLRLREIAQRQQHVVHAVGALHVVLRIEALELPLDRVHRVGVEQLAQLRVAEQLAQL